MNILTISGSPAAQSRSNRLLGHVREWLAERGVIADHLSVRDLPPQAALHADFDHPQIIEALQRVALANTVIIATPIYKAAYSGALKVFLDLLPQSGLRDKTVLPLATGGSLAHALAIDYALRPVLTSLGARQVLPAIFAVDQQLAWSERGGLVLEAPLSERLEAGLFRLLADLPAELIKARADRRMPSERCHA